MNINLKSIYPVLEGWGYARALTSFKLEEDAARQGYNYAVTILSQLSEAFAVTQQVSELEQVSGKTYLTGKARIFVYLSAPSIGALETANWVKKSAIAQKSVHWLYVNFGSMCQVASIVVNVALLRLGHRAYATTALSILSLGYLERKGLLPSRISKIYLKFSPWVGLTGLLLTGDLISRTIAATEIYSRLYDIFFFKASTPYAPSSSSKLSYEQFNQILEGKATLKMGRNHIYITPFPIIENPTFIPLKQLCETFAWQEPSVYKQLEEKLEKDARWTGSQEYVQTQNASAEKQKELKIAYAQSRFNILINSVEKECIETGMPLDYGTLKNYLAYIAEKLPYASEEMQIQIMLQLAVDGGDYCGAGAYYQLETAATALLCGSNQGARLPLTQRLLIILQQERMKIMTAYHLLISQANPILHHVHGGQGDVHAMNHTINMLGADFGLPNQGANEDRAAAISYIAKRVVPLALGMNPSDLWKEKKIGNEICKGYIQERAVQAIKDQIGTALVPTTDIFDWAQNWIETTQATDEQKETFLEKLTDGESFQFQEKFTIGFYSFKDSFIQAMLVDMGILEAA
jgi:ATP-dependent Clp protease adapter protein ClpS